CASRFGLCESLVDRGDVFHWSESRFFRIYRTDPICERFLAGNFPAQTCVVEMAMGVDQTWQQCALSDIDHWSGIASFDLSEISNVEDLISGNCYCAIPNRRSIHRYDGTGTNDHSAFTTFRHAATKRLQGSWQSSGTAAVVAVVTLAL